MKIQPDITPIQYKMSVKFHHLQHPKSHHLNRLWMLLWVLKHFKTKYLSTCRYVNLENKRSAQKSAMAAGPSDSKCGHYPLKRERNGREGESLIQRNYEVKL